MAKKPQSKRTVESLTHSEAKRKNIPTAEYQSVIQKDEERPKTIKYPRNTDLDPQLVWRGKDEEDWSDLVVHAPPLYIQEKVHPKVIIDDLMKSSEWIVASKNAGGQAAKEQLRGLLSPLSDGSFAQQKRRAGRPTNKVWTA